MCITFFGTQLLPGVKFLVAFNRDEYINRPTQNLHWWPDKPWVLAGRDTVGHGTWLGCSKHGRLAFLTNLRLKDLDPADTSVQRISRGALPTGFFTSTTSAMEYLQSLDGERFQGFNLICADVSAPGAPDTAYTNNLGTARSQQARLAASRQEVPTNLEHGKLYGLSNGTLGEWDKVKQGVECGERLLRQCHAKEPAGCCCHQEGDCSACNGGANGGHTEGDGHTKHCSVPWEELFTVLLGDTARDESQRPAGVRVAPVTDALRSGVLRVRSNSHQPSPEPESAGGNTVGASAAGAASAAAATAATERAASGVFEFGPDILNVDDHLEYVVSSRFIAPVPSKYGPYGTRSQTVMVVWEDGLVECRERYIDVMGHQDGCAVGEVVDGCCMGDQDVPVWRQIVQKFHVEPQKL